MRVSPSLKRTIRRMGFRVRDIHNRIRFGPDAPRYAELIWVRPEKVQYALMGPTGYGTCSGKVIDLDTHFTRTELSGTPRIKSSVAHWTQGVPWEQTKDYEVMLRAIRNGKDWAGCRTEEDLKRRFSQLDRTFEQVQREGRLRTRQELDPQAFREEGGILVCVGPDAEPLLYDGFHRMAIALILRLPIIPAQLGYVDRAAVASLGGYRAPELARPGEQVQDP